MRITTGLYKGHSITGPKTNATRPMTDKIRAALFNILGPIDGLTVLDAYAGSGALGLEALSRGAASVVAIESGKEASNTIRANLKKLSIAPEIYDLRQTTAELWITHQEGEFDLIFAMPPYSQINAQVLTDLGGRLRKGGILVVEYPSREQIENLAKLTEIKKREYGDATLVFYRSSEG